jgi:hypothetical protein
MKGDKGHALYFVGLGNQHTICTTANSTGSTDNSFKNGQADKHNSTKLAVQEVYVCRHSSVAIAIKYGLEGRNSLPESGKRAFFLRCPLSLSSDGYKGLFLGVGVGVVKAPDE